MDFPLPAATPVGSPEPRAELLVAAVTGEGPALDPCSTSAAQRGATSVRAATPPPPQPPPQASMPRLPTASAIRRASTTTLPSVASTVHAGGPPATAEEAASSAAAVPAAPGSDRAGATSAAPEAMMSVETLTTKFESAYLWTRHRNVRCFPTCGPSHKERSFCGAPVTVRVSLGSLSKLNMRYLYVFGEFRRSDEPYRYRADDVVPAHEMLLNAPSGAVERPNHFPGELVEVRSGATVGTYQIRPPGKWRYPCELERTGQEGSHAFTVYALDMVTSKCVSLADSPSFRILAAWKEADKAAVTVKRMRFGAGVGKGGEEDEAAERGGDGIGETKSAHTAQRQLRQQAIEAEDRSAAAAGRNSAAVGPAATSFTSSLSGGLALVGLSPPNFLGAVAVQGAAGLSSGAAALQMREQRRGALPPWPMAESPRETSRQGLAVLQGLPLHTAFSWPQAWGAAAPASSPSVGNALAAAAQSEPWLLVPCFSVQAQPQAQPQPQPQPQGVHVLQFTTQQWQLQLQHQLQQQLQQQPRLHAQPMVQGPQLAWLQQVQPAQLQQWQEQLQQLQRQLQQTEGQQQHHS